MGQKWFLCLAAAVLAVVAAFTAPVLAADGPAVKIAIVVGPSQHPPGTHEVAAGARVMEYCLNHLDGMPPVRAEVFTGWPGAAKLEGVASIVFIGDLFPPVRLPEPDRVLAEVGAMMDRGCGLACIHYATGLRAEHVSETGDHPLLRWMGGYFATGCKHHKSVARVVPATISPAEGDHPVLRGWKEFTFDDEPYWNNYFGHDGPAANVAVLATTMLPPESPTKQTVVWGVERTDGGRGLGCVMPHYYRNWWNDDLRQLVLNGICWTAKLDIPAGGVQTTLPPQAEFSPEVPAAAK
jgi:type 1 glutamine amidotransferase